MYASFTHASAHPDIRTVRGLSGTEGVSRWAKSTGPRVWLAVPRRRQWGGWPVVSGRTIMTASLQRTTLRAGRRGWGLGRYAQSTRGRDGRQTAERSQVRGFRRLRAWALASCDAGKPGLPAVRVRPQRERKPRSAARLSDGRACSGLAHPPWPRAAPGRPWPGRPGLCLSPQGAWGVLYGT